VSDEKNRGRKPVFQAQVSAGKAPIADRMGRFLNSRW
jgi:hypothetical protein